jgi:hypothetical protein
MMALPADEVTKVPGRLGSGWRSVRAVLMRLHDHDRRRLAMISIGLAALAALAAGAVAAWLLRNTNVSTATILFAVSIPTAAVAGAAAPFVESAFVRRSR